MKAAFLVTGFKFGENGFIVSLAGGDEVIEDASKLMRCVFDRLWRAVPCALGSVIVAQVRFVVVKRLSGQTKGAGDAVFCFNFWAPDAATGAGTVFGANVEPGRETVRSCKLRQVGAEFAKDGLNAKALETGDPGEIDAEDPFQMVAEVETGFGRRYGFGRRIGSRMGIMICRIEGLEKLLDLLITFVNELLVVPVGDQRLSERKDMFAAIIAGQAFGHRFERSFDPGIPQFS